MSGLSGDAFVKALQSETVTLLVGNKEEPITISKALLAAKSALLSKFVEKGHDTIGMQTDSITAVKLFTCWCYQERLQTLQPGANSTERQKWTHALIDLWIFGARYQVSRLQNETMQALVLLLQQTPHLLDKKDIRNIWEATTLDLSDDALRTLAVFVMVVQIEEGSTGEDKKSIRDFEEALADLEGWMSKVYVALGKWLRFEMPKLTKRGKTKWMLFTQDPDIRMALMVKERVRTSQAAGVGGNGTGDDGVKPNGFRGFAPGEVIELG